MKNLLLDQYNRMPVRYSRMLSELTECASILGLDPIKLADEADKCASETASRFCENSRSPDKTMILGFLLEFAWEVQAEMNRQIDSVPVPVPVWMKVCEHGYPFSGVRQIVSDCIRELEYYDEIPVEEKGILNFVICVLVLCILITTILCIV